MNPWNHLLEALHSALIDEITAEVLNRKKLKPELGMPIRKMSWEIPSPGTDEFLVIPVSLASQSGAVALAWESDFQKILGTSLLDLWEKVLFHATLDFTRRGIQPAWSKTPQKMDQKGFLNMPSTNRVVWIPLKLNGLNCFLGVGLT